jgi:hypothetical protein
MGEKPGSRSTVITPDLKYNNQIAEATAHALNGGAHGLKTIPGLIKITIEKNTWKARYVDRLQRIVKCESFQDYVTRNPPEGLGSDRETLERLCQGEGNEDVLVMLRAATTTKQGVTKGNKNALKSYTSGYKEDSPKTKSDDITVCFDSKPIRGTSKSYSLTRLEKHRPDLYEQVREKKLSANAAMIQAGFRPKTITIAVDVEKAARALVKNFQEDTDKLIEAIQRLL